MVVCRRYHVDVEISVLHQRFGDRPDHLEPVREKTFAARIPRVDDKFVAFDEVFEDRIELIVETFVPYPDAVYGNNAVGCTQTVFDVVAFDEQHLQGQAFFACRGNGQTHIRIRRRRI